MKKFGCGRVVTTVVGCFALVVAGAFAAKEKISAEVSLPGADETGALDVELSGPGAAKGSVNTKNGKVRVTFKGEALNLGTKAAKFKNSPEFAALIEGEFPLTVDASKYSVGKPKKNAEVPVGKAKGNVKGTAAIL